MLNRQFLKAVVCFTVIGLYGAVGCTPPASPPPVKAPVADDHGHDDHGHDDHDHDDHGHDDDHDHDHGAHDHGDHDHSFATLSEAMVEVEELSAEIGKAFTSGDPESAHDSLHHIGEVLEATESLVKESSLEGDAKEAAAKAVVDLFDSFTAIDETLHDQEGKAYGEVKATIESAISTLKASAK